MTEKSPTKKAWETMNSASAGKKAHYTRRRGEGARKAGKKVQEKQWEPEKVKYLSELGRESTPNVCVVCSDDRPIVLHDHHLAPQSERTIKLCANCHDIVRRGTLKDLKQTRKGSG